MTNRAFTVADWREELGKSRPTVLKMLHSGLIPGFRTNGDSGHWYTPIGLVEAWREGRWNPNAASEIQPIRRISKAA